MPKHSENRPHRKLSILLCGISLAALCFFLLAAHAQGTRQSQAANPTAAQVQPQPRLIEILADRDSRFKVSGQEKPVITLTTGQEIRLRITAVKAKNRNRDGSIHGFTLLHAKDRAVVPGWDFLLQPGVQEFLVTAPAEPGEYQVVCTVICSSGHEQMNMKVIVVSNGG
jgi:hypothetical protein